MLSEVVTRDPLIIQGGMGVAVSNWCLAKAVSQTGQLGVVSGTALNHVFVERLKHGDPGGHVQRALKHFPFPTVAAEMLEKYLIPASEDFPSFTKAIPLYSINPNPELLRLTVVSNFCEVFLAKEGHGGKVGINFLEKIQMPNLPSIYGAMLANVDYVLMGAGIPREIPQALDKLANNEKAALTLHVDNASSDDTYQFWFNPVEVFGDDLPKLNRPQFIAIVSSNTLATALAKKSTGRIDGFVVEKATAGGHNAPPRGNYALDEKGQPIYGPRDTVNLEQLKELGIPFWLAGGYGSPAKLVEALENGAQGVQVGTAFAFCQESGLHSDYKKIILGKVMNNEAEVITDTVASPTGFPFKVVQMEGTVSEEAVYQERPRLCQLGYLRQAYKRDDGSLGYRCPGEPQEEYVRKGGRLEDTVGRRCLCNGLMANIGFPQRHKDGYVEKPLITAGDDINELKHFIQPGALEYSATDVIHYLLSGISGLDRDTNVNLQSASIKG